MGRRALIWLAVAVAMGSAFGVGFELRAHSLRPPSPGAATASGPLRAQVLAELAGHYYENVPARATQAHTVNGVLAALGDPYTEYLAPAAYRDLLESQAGGYAGVGLALARGPNGLIVRASLPGLPAWKAGIRPGDVITAVDDRNLAGVPYGSAVGLIHGASGTPVHLLIQRPGQPVPVLLTLVREPVRLTRVTSERMGEGAASVVVIRIPAFSEGTAADVRRIVTAA